VGIALQGTPRADDLAILVDSAAAILVAEKTGEWEKLENLVQNQLIRSIVGARHAAAPRNGRRNNVGGIMTV